MAENISGKIKNDIKITCGQNAAVFCVKVLPASSRTCLAGVQNGILKIKVSAAPEKGKANQSLIEFLADTLGVKKNTVKITSGHTSQIKTVQIANISVEFLLSRIL